MKSDIKDIESRLTQIKDIRREKSELSVRESELIEPIIDDLTMIKVIYDIYLKYLKDNNEENNTTNRQKFIFVVLYLFSMGTLVGGKMKVGVRDIIAEVTGCTRTLISHNCTNTAFMYSHYREFKLGVDEIIRRVAENLNISVNCYIVGCHGKGYNIRMFDGSVKAVENIVVGDKVMGDDGTPRNVVSLQRGRGRLMKVKPKKGNYFLVNEGHILSLYSTKQHEYVEMTVLSFYHQQSLYKKRLMLHCGNGEFVRFEVYRTRKTDDYYGFSIDGNHLYLDGQGFIHHNIGENDGIAKGVCF